jgi:hypothetical protein
MAFFAVLLAKLRRAHCPEHGGMYLAQRCW